MTPPLYSTPTFPWGSTAFNPTTPQFTIKLKDPPMFDGNVNKDVDTWLMSVNDYLHVTHTSDTDGVNYIVTLLSDTAKEWWYSYLAQRNGVRPTTVAEISAALKDRFGSELREKRARTALRDIRIKSGESVRDYSARFTAQLQKLPGFDKAWALDQYIHGLPQRVAELVTIAGITSLDKAVKKAEEIEMARTLTGGQLPTSGGGRGRGGNASRRGNGRGRGAQNSQGRGNRGRNGFGGGRGWRGRRNPRGGGAGRQGNCYICGSPDHWSNRCPQKNTDSRGGSQTARGNKVPSRTALHTTMGADDPERVSDDSEPPAAAESSRTSGN